MVTVFLLAGLAKLPRRDEFERAVLNYDLLPRSAARIVGRWLPLGEVAAAVLLGVGVAIAPVTSFLAILLAVFIAAVALNLLRKKKMECGCFGSSGAPRQMTWWVVARNALLLAMTVLILASPPASLTLWPGWATAGSRAVTNDEAAAMLITATVAVLAALVAQESWMVRKLFAALEEAAT